MPAGIALRHVCLDFHSNGDFFADDSAPDDSPNVCTEAFVLSVLMVCGTSRLFDPNISFWFYDT